MAPGRTLGSGVSVPVLDTGAWALEANLGEPQTLLETPPSDDSPLAPLLVLALSSHSQLTIRTSCLDRPGGSGG